MQYLTSMLLCGTSLALVFAFGSIAIIGSYHAIEDNTLILAIELLISVGCFLTGIVGMIKCIKREDSN